MSRAGMHGVGMRGCPLTLPVSLPRAGAERPGPSHGPTVSVPVFAWVFGPPLNSLRLEEGAIAGRAMRENPQPPP
ncbi:MAG: hypothetical protein KatS3mg058_1948 [Roseiflexus sp.]|nr:MAG: hypothetical protein KatS3mg058_1948 [Roseiflexus sp.]